MFTASTVTGKTWFYVILFTLIPFINVPFVISLLYGDFTNEQIMKFQRRFGIFYVVIINLICFMLVNGNIRVGRL